MKLSSELKKTAAIVASILGLASSIISLFTTSYNSLNVWLGVGIIIVTIILVLIILLIIPKNNMPLGMEDVADELGNANRSKTVRIIFPCNNRFYKGANKLAREKFGKNSVSSKKVDDWKNKNDLILTCLTDKNKLVGYFDIIPLKTSFARNLLEGSVSENDISSEHILAQHEMLDAEYIYFAGIAVEYTNSGKGYLHGTYLIFAAILYTYLFYGDSRLKKILTIPTSECGLKIAEHLDFKIESDGKLRKDGLDLYSHDFSRSELHDLIQKRTGLFNRFDSLDYKIAFKKINGELKEMPLNI